MLTSEFAPAKGGIGTYARELASAATALGANITVFAPDYAQDTASNDRSLAFRMRRFRGGLHSMRDLPSKVYLARKAIGTEHYDVIHAADWPFFIPVALSRRRSGARVIMTLHGTEIYETQTFLKRLAINTCDVFGGSTEIVANSQFTRNLFRSFFEVAPERINAVPLGVSSYWFEHTAERPAVRARYDIAADNIVLVTVARLTRRKGHTITAAAIASLPAALRRRITWLIVGPDGEADYVTELERAIDDADYDVRKLGAVPDSAIRDFYAAADIFCMTGLDSASGRVEGFGLVYLEAAAAGLPSIATRVGGVPEAVIADRTGLLVEPSAAAVAQAIALMADNAELRLRYANAALAHARNLSWTRCAARTYALPQDEKS
jgi:glycosyltransferase involved in cell wall biosynthesis